MHKRLLFKMLYDRLPYITTRLFFYFCSFFFRNKLSLSGCSAQLDSLDCCSTVACWNDGQNILHRPYRSVRSLESLYSLNLHQPEGLHLLSDGQWVYDRIMVVNCPNVIPKEKQDKKLLDKMYAERDGIVYKAVTALQTVISNGYRFSEPASVTAARKEYKGTNSTVISFFEECMCPWQSGKINRHCTTGRIYIGIPEAY